MKVGSGDSIKPDRFGAYDLGFDQIRNNFSTLDVARGIWIVGREFVVGTVELTSSLVCAIANKVHKTVSGHFWHVVRSDCVAKVGARVCGFFIKDRGLDATITRLRDELRRKSGTYHYIEFEKVFTTTVMTSIKQDLERAGDHKPAPEWVSRNLLTKEGEYGLQGKVVLQLLKQHEPLLQKALSCTLLRIFSNIFDVLQRVQSENPHVLLDTLVSILEQVPHHFHECRAREQAQREATYTPVDPQMQRSAMLHFYRLVSTAVLELVFRHGPKDIELPISATAASYLSAFLFDLMKTKAIPEALEKGFATLSEQDIKDRFFVELFKVMHKEIDEETEIGEDQATSYPRINECSTALHEAIRCFLDYVDPTFLPWILPSIVPYRFAAGMAATIAGQCETKTLQKMLCVAIEEFLPKLNPGGSWVECDGGRVFQMKGGLPASFAPGTATPIRTEIQRLIDITGQDQKGLIQRIKSKMGALPSKPVGPCAPSAGVLASVTATVGTGYHYLAHGAAVAGLWTGAVSARIKNLNTALYAKMSLPGHELLAYDIMRLVLTAFNRKLVFPNLRDIRFMKREESANWF